MREKALYFFILFTFLGIFPCPSQASTPSESGLSRTLKIWDRQIEYQLLIKNDPTLQHDGEAFTKKVKGQKIAYVVLNPAFLEKEARTLFERFQREKKSSSPLKSLTRQELLQLEQKFMTLEKGKVSFSSLSPSMHDALKKMRNLFEERAWRDLYDLSLKKAGNPEGAEKLFSKDFAERRMKILEHHEAAHLYDILKSSNTKSAAFGRFTEMNAFYAELTYGENPHDTMAQAVSGLIDEMSRGKTVDYSIEKVMSVVQFLRNCPEFAKSFKPGPLSKCCLEMLAKISRRDFIQIGQELYRSHQNLFKNTFASL